MADDVRGQLPTTRRRFLGLTAAGAGLLGAGALLTPSPAGADAADRPGLPGAWRASVTIDNGPFAGALQFLLVYDSGGGMVESSNFDEATPVPPAYGSWASNGSRTFRSTYIFFTTKPPEDPSTLANAGWSFSGTGKFREQITLARDGESYLSLLYYQLYDTSDIALAGQSGTGHTAATRIVPEPFEAFGP